MAQVKGDDGSSSGIDPLGPSFVDVINGVSDYAIWGDTEGGYGVVGTSRNGPGVSGISANGTGVHGESQLAGPLIDIATFADGGIGVAGENNLPGGIGVVGKANGPSGKGVRGQADDSVGVGVLGMSVKGLGVLGSSETGIGVRGTSTNPNRTGASPGVRGDGVAEDGVWAISKNANGLYAMGGNYAAYLEGKVFISGPLEKPGGSFKIDHPLDPLNKYLCHSFVESPDMKNIYDGVVDLDSNGEAVVGLPAWFGALNKEYCYQLTCIGGYAPVYVAQEVHGNCFRIAGGRPRMRISWQLTGIRQDAWAKAHRIVVEQEKRTEERGHYLYPDLQAEVDEEISEPVGS